MILGIDEVGRGPWAGPLVVGAVVLGEREIPGLTDSKKLTARRRAILDVKIRAEAAAYGLGWVSATEIDEIGLSAALRLATIRAVEHIEVPYHEIMIDGTINFLAETTKGSYVTTLPKGDLLIPAISAASIIAKVARDAYMAEQDALYHGYGFSSHVGYGTAAHRAAIDKLGVTPLHRTSFAPLQKYRSEQQLTTDVGQAAEGLVAEHLKSKGHTVIARNWKTRFVEIDVISHFRGTVFFTEVKYRKTDQQGGGLAAITPAKLQQMRRAAEWYIHSYKMVGCDARLAVASVEGSPMMLTTWIPLSD